MSTSSRYHTPKVKINEDDSVDSDYSDCVTMELRNLDLDLGLNKENTACWTYRGEGNANLILALDGQNKVLRLKKSLKSQKITVTKNDNLTVSELDKGDSGNVQIIKNKSETKSLYATKIKPNGIQERNICVVGRDLKSNNESANNSEISRSILERCIWETRWWKTFTKLLGTCYTIRDDEKIEIVDLTSCDLSKLNQMLDILRPPSRRHKLVASEYAVMFPDFTLMPETDDLCYGDTFTFELKPKHGWTPYVIDVNESTEYAKCPYCLTQFLKYKKGKINKISGYCPLDLFSGDEIRMNKAIKCIIEVPQNNFKVFRNGHAVQHNDLSDILKILFNTNLDTSTQKSDTCQNNSDSSFVVKRNLINNSSSEECNTHDSQLSNKKLKMCHQNINDSCEQNTTNKIYNNSNTTFDILNHLANLIRITLLRNFNKSQDCNEQNLIKKSIHYDSAKLKYLQKLKDLNLETCYTNKDANALPKGCILERLLNLQLLDCDVLLQDLSKGSGYEYIEGTLKVLENSQGCLNDLTDLEKSMMAATVKDCSIMLTFRRVKDLPNNTTTNSCSNGFVGSTDQQEKQILEENDQTVMLNGQKFMARVSVIDLDLKPESRIDNYLKHIQDMFKACLEFLENQRD